jgi:hypothetical protein
VKSILSVASALTLVLSGAAFAQAEQEFVEAFAGDWVSYDDAYSVDGERCRVSLTDTATEAGYAVKVASCALELGMLTDWRIVDNQLSLLAGDTAIAVLGGNQRRISGDSNIGAPVILDRAGDTALIDSILKAREASGCYYLGFTTTCVDEAQLAKPAVASDGSASRIGVLVNLNVRAEARDDAPVLGVVPANSCIVTEICATAADGVWCKARFDDTAGWLKKLALRQERWPVVTFVNQCTPAP